MQHTIIENINLQNIIILLIIIIITSSYFMYRYRNKINNLRQFKIDFIKKFIYSILETQINPDINNLNKIIENQKDIIAKLKLKRNLTFLELFKFKINTLLNEMSYYDNENLTDERVINIIEQELIQKFNYIL
ncbi:MAG: hypothetical protein Q8888_01430 [Vigna little leaf phytoplasma]|nr:hypothetical protein [Vigna little leaf phytoplasma]